MILAVRSIALTLAWPFSRRKISDSSHMIALLKALNASMFVIWILWSVTITLVPEDLVFTSGRVRRPKTPPGPAMSSSIEDMVAPTGPVLVTLESIDMMKELEALSVLGLRTLGPRTYSLVASVILIWVTSSTDRSVIN